METDVSDTSKTVEVKDTDALLPEPKKSMVDDPPTNVAEKDAEAPPPKIKRSGLSPFACCLLVCCMRDKGIRVSSPLTLQYTC